MKNIFSNKEFDSLIAENLNLKSKIETYEVRPSVRDKNIAELTKQLDAANETIDSLNDKLSKSIPMEDFAIMKKNCLDEIERLENQIKYRPHNERGAGRKNRAAPEQCNQILELRSMGKSYGEICKILNDETGCKWNRATIRNIIMAVKELTDLHTPKTQNIAPKFPRNSQI